MEICLPFTSFLGFYQFRVVTIIQSSAARQSGKFRQKVNDTHRSYRTKIPNQNFRIFFINGKQPKSHRLGIRHTCTWNLESRIEDCVGLPFLNTQGEKNPSFLWVAQAREVHFKRLRETKSKDSEEHWKSLGPNHIDSNVLRNYFRLAFNACTPYITIKLA